MVGESDSDVVVERLVDSARLAMAGRRRRLLPPSPRWVASSEPARLAMDVRRWLVEALRVQPLAGRETLAGVVPSMRPSRGLSDPRLARRPAVRVGRATRRCETGRWIRVGGPCQRRTHWAAGRCVAHRRIARLERTRTGSESDPARSVLLRQRPPEATSAVGQATGLPRRDARRSGRRAHPRDPRRLTV